MDQNRIKQLIAHAETGSLRDMAAALRELAAAYQDLAERVEELEKEE